ncbi:MAG TPA: hypothetical protein PKX07_15070 [Aggregatilineales bacterium]|jgi:hypothetical protein|nr:hypothetical protein [Aggregatilineales bacterium]
MGFLRNLFGGGSRALDEGRRALYYYVRPKRCTAIIKVRIDTLNDLSLTDEGGYFCRKIVRGERCPFPAELHVDFDKNHKVKQVGVQDGDLVEEAEYLAWLDAQ